MAEPFHDDDAALAPPSTLTPEELKLALETAKQLKTEGNEHFRAGEWNEALVAYRTGLGHLPKRKQEKPDAQSALDNLDPESPPHPSDSVEEITSPAVVKAEFNQEEEDCSKARAVLNSNIAACLVKLGEHKAAVEACTAALLDDPKYVKALQRRATSNETLNSWSSLSAAQTDYTTLLQLLSPGSAQYREIVTALKKIKPRVEAAQKEETAEMLGKLKGIGNSILGNFGLSTDNFKFEPNGQGGYSLNFAQK